MPNAVYIHDGATLDYTAGADVTAGDVINIGSGLVGVAPRDIANGETGALQVRGVVRVTKATDASLSFSAGDQVDWDDSAKTAVDDGGAFRLGVAAYDAGNTDASVAVILNQNPAVAAVDNQ